MPQPIMPARGGPPVVFDKTTYPAPQPRPAEQQALVPAGPAPTPAAIVPAKLEKVALPAAMEVRKIPAAPVIIPPAPKPEEMAQHKPDAARNGNDPFADLDTLEAEMARLLGRDKLS
jgi:flagellar protein FliO/FliZ